MQICTTPGSGLGCVVYVLRELFGLELRMHISRLKSVLFVVYDQYFISPIKNLDNSILATACHFHRYRWLNSHRAIVELFSLLQRNWDSSVLPTDSPVKADG